MEMQEMLDEIAVLRERFSAAGTVDGSVDQMYETAKQLGFDALIYDYTPVPFDYNGDIMLPSLLKLRNIADDMPDYWCNRGYFRIDPVQRLHSGRGAEVVVGTIDRAAARLRG